MKTSGLNVNAKAIGAGIYAMICAKGEEAIVAFGMIPSWAMDLLRKELREKVVSVAAEKVGCTAEELELMGVIDEKAVGKIVAEIEHAVAVEIYGAAAAAGRMVV